MESDKSFLTPISRDWRTRGAVYASVLCSYLSAAHNDALRVPMISVFLLAALWSLTVEHRFLRPFFPASLKIGVIACGSVIFAALFVGGFTTSSGPFSNAIARFLFWNAIVFVLSRHKTEYDVWTLAIINVSLHMISGAFVQPPLFFPLLLATLISLLYGFSRLSLLRCGIEQANPPHTRTVLVIQGVLVLELALLVFLFFPRTLFREHAGSPSAVHGETSSPPERPLTEGGPATRIGLPDNPSQIGLDSLSRLKTDPTVVLRLRIDSSSEGSRYVLGQPIYIRGSTYERYENGQWYAPSEPQRRTADAEGWISVRPDIQTLDELRQRIVTRPSRENIAWAVGEPLRLRWPTARYDSKGTFFLDDGGEHLEYEIISAFVPNGVDLRLEEIPVRPSPRLTALPPGLDQLRRQALELTSTQQSPASKILALSRWLEHEAHLSYSLAAFHTPTGTDPLEHFLFSARAGTCMHFASALALLCRALGIPARLAGGFYARDFDWTKRAYTVRQQDAHAWVEVPFAGLGWVRFDGTPTHPVNAQPMPGVETLPPVATTDRPNASTSSTSEPSLPPKRWDHLLVDFDPESQSNAIQSFFQHALSLLSRIARGATSLPVLVCLGTLGITALLAYLFLPQRRRVHLRQWISGFRNQSTIPFYHDFLWLLSKRGLLKPPGSTAQEFAKRVAPRVPTDAVTLLIQKFYSVKYGGRSLTQEEERDVELALAAVERALSQS